MSPQVESAVWSGRGLEAAQQCDTKTIHSEGAHLCFGCAIQSIPDMMDNHNSQQSVVSTTLTDLVMWLNQHSYLNGRKVQISQLAALIRLGSRCTQSRPQTMTPLSSSCLNTVNWSESTGTSRRGGDWVQAKSKAV